MLEQHFGFTDCPSIQVFNSPPSPNTVIEVAQGSLPVTVQQLYDLQNAMHSSCMTYRMPLPLHREAADFYVCY